jgi:hypothetical protein
MSLSTSPVDERDAGAATELSHPKSNADRDHLRSEGTLPETNI